METYELASILCSQERDFLVRNNGDQVKVSSLTGKIVGLYFSASWCGPCKQFTPKLLEVYNELKQNGNFEIVFLSGDRNEESFNDYFSKMPWLAIPFIESETRKKLNKLFSVRGIPHFVILDGNGKVLTNNGVKIIKKYEAAGYPFVPEHIKELEEEAYRNQSLISLLVSQTRDFVSSSDGRKVPVAELEGKTVGLYFSSHTNRGCVAFNPILQNTYNSLKDEGQDFEIVMVPLDNDEETFNKEFEKLSWLSLPIKDEICQKLVTYFELRSLPTVVIIGPNGKTLNANVAETIENHGKVAFPFTPEIFAEIAEIEKAKQEAQTLESILVSGDSDFVIAKDGAKIPVSTLIGKNVLLYFSAHWCPPCRAFLPKLIHAYKEINEKNNNSLEVIFLSSDKDQPSFDEFFATMPWLALPFGDDRKKSLSRLFKVQGIPTVVAIGPTGKTVTREAQELIARHGAKAYPFTSERVKEIEVEIEKLAESWPKKVTNTSHVHELVLVKRRAYICDGCGVEGWKWSYYCEECDFDLHPKCALGDDDKVETNAEEDEEKKTGAGAGEGWICDGDKCSKK